MATKRRKTAHSAAQAKRRLRLAVPKVARARSSDPGDITAKPMLIGYARVSTVDQNLALQRDALTEAGCAKIFTEQMSGAVTDRPALHDALEFARSGDTLIVWKLDRLARSMKQLIETVETLRMRCIGFRSLTEALDTTTAQGRLVFHMFGALAEFERSLIRERTQAGLAAARRAGRTGGRPPKLTEDDLEAARALLANPDIGVTQIAHRLGVSPATPIVTSRPREPRIPRRFKADLRQLIGEGVQPVSWSKRFEIPLHVSPPAADSIRRPRDYLM
jgi:DNA invertase Pin-like site-specific DNA recombinase